MALDELRDNDEIYEVSNIQYIINKDFLEKAQPIKVDFTPTGFQINSNIDLGESCGSCNTQGSCCS